MHVTFFRLALASKCQWMLIKVNFRDNHFGLKVYLAWPNPRAPTPYLKTIDGKVTSFQAKEEKRLFSKWRRKAPFFSKSPRKCPKTRKNDPKPKPSYVLKSWRFWRGLQKFLETSEISKNKFLDFFLNLKLCFRFLEIFRNFGDFLEFWRFLKA